jgi:hypothetical protein
MEIPHRVTPQAQRWRRGGGLGKHGASSDLPDIIGVLPRGPKVEIAHEGGVSATHDMYRRGILLGIECKTGKALRSEGQTKLHEEWIRAGAVMLTIRNVVELRAALGPYREVR